MHQGNVFGELGSLTRLSIEHLKYRGTILSRILDQSKYILLVHQTLLFFPLSEAELVGMEAAQLLLLVHLAESSTAFHGPLYVLQL